MNTPMHTNLFIADGGRNGRRAFTLVELLVSIVVIGVIMGLLITGLNAAGVFARTAASRQTVVAIKNATTQFNTEFGFIPPLVYDGSDMGGGATGHGAFSSIGPVFDQTFGRVTRKVATVYRAGAAETRAFLQGSEVAGAGSFDAAYRDARYSKFSIPFYVMGALGEQVDGVEGPGMVKPAPDGTWVGVGDAMAAGNKRFEPFMDGGRSAAHIEPEYVDSVEAGVLGGAVPNAAARANRLALVDSNGVAFRYYRWIHEDTVQNPRDLNIPAVLIDPLTLQSSFGNTSVDVTEGNAELRSASWAIVGAGPDGVFGTEPLDVLRQKLSGVSGASEAQVRQKAMQDNLVELGR